MQSESFFAEQSFLGLYWECTDAWHSRQCNKFGKELNCHVCLLNHTYLHQTQRPQQAESGVLAKTSSCTFRQLPCTEDSMKAECHTCPDEVHDVVANQYCACGGMAGNKAPSAIAVICCALRCQLLAQLHWPTGPVYIRFALLEEVWPKSSSSDLGGFTESFYRDKGTETVQQEVQDGRDCVGDVPVLQLVHPELISTEGDDEGCKGDEDCNC